MNRVDGQEPLNLAILIGIVSGEPRSRTLPSGDRLLGFDLRVPTGDGSRQSISVTWIGPESKAPTVAADAGLMVVGEVRRRFFRAGGSLASRVDVRAIRIVKSAKASQRALAALL